MRLDSGPLVIGSATVGKSSRPFDVRKTGSDSCLIPGKDFLPANPQRREDTSMKSPPSSFAKIFTPPQQCTAQAKLCLDSAEASQPVDALPTVRAPIHPSARSFKDIHGKNLFGSSEAVDQAQRDELPLPPNAEKAAVHSFFNIQDRAHAKSRQSDPPETPIRGLRQNCDDKRGVEDARLRKHATCKVDQPNSFWDWLSTSKLKDASGNTYGQEGYDPSSVLIPKQHYDEMTG